MANKQNISCLYDLRSSIGTTAPEPLLGKNRFRGRCLWGFWPKSPGVPGSCSRDIPRCPKAGPDHRPASGSTEGIGGPGRGKWGRPDPLQSAHFVRFHPGRSGNRQEHRNICPPEGLIGRSGSRSTPPTTPPLPDNKEAVSWVDPPITGSAFFLAESRKSVKPPLGAKKVFPYPPLEGELIHPWEISPFGKVSGFPIN